MLEVIGRMGDFENPYEGRIETSGYDNPKLLLQLERVNGLNIKELVGVDTSMLHQDIWVATYEIEEWDSALNRNIMKPIKEYYRKDENGEMIIVGTGTDKSTTFNLDGLQMQVESDKIVQGNSLEKVTQKEMVDRLIKNGIEDSMKNGKVTEVAELTDIEFLRDFSKQCGIPENWDLAGRTFIVSSINEKGEEDFDIIIRNDPDTKYEHLMGIQATEKSGREIYTSTDIIIPGAGTKLDKTKTLKEFETKSGHRYSITRDAKGKLIFNEIFRENENITQGQHVDSYTFSTNNDLIKKYENIEISQGELDKAFETIKRTKSEKEQNREEDKNTYRGG